MKRAIPITTLFLDIGSVLLTNRWRARIHSNMNFKLGNMLRTTHLPPIAHVHWQNFIGIMLLHLLPIGYIWRFMTLIHPLR